MTLPKDKAPLFYSLFALSIIIPLLSSSFGWLGLIPLAVAIFLMHHEYAELEDNHKDLVESVKILREETSTQLESLSESSKNLSDAIKAIDQKIASFTIPEQKERVIETIREAKSFMPLAFTYATLILMCIAGFLAYRSSKNEMADALSTISKTNTKVASLENNLSNTNARVTESIARLRETLDSHVERLQNIKSKIEEEVNPATSNTSSATPIIKRRGNNPEQEPQTKNASLPEPIDRARLEIPPTAAAAHPFQSFKSE